MLSKNAKYVLEVALTNAKLADEISARLISTAPADAAAASAVLATLQEELNKKVEEYLIVALASKTAGKELAAKINGMVEVLKAQANGEEVAAVAAQFDGQVAGMTTDVVIDADVAGVAGNVTIVADLISDIDALIAAWNLANVGNELTLTDGDGSQIPTADIVLAGGADASGSDIDALIAAWNLANVGNELTLTTGDGAQVPTEDIELTGGADASDADIAATQDAMGSDHMSEYTFKHLVVALASQPVAEEFKAAYDAMIDVVQSI